MPQFDTTTFLPQIFWLVCLFGFLYLIVKMWIFPSMQMIFQTREKKLKSTLKEAETLKEEINRIEEKIDHHLTQAKKQAQYLIKETAKTLEEKHDQKEKQFMVEIDEKMKQVETEIKKEAVNFDKKADTLVKDLVHLIFARLVGEDANEQYINQALEKVKKS